MSLPKFQSFFYWKSASKTSPRRANSNPPRRFNPSSIGNRPQSTKMVAALEAEGSFNPSSIGNRPQRKKVILSFTAPTMVSILLLLEIGLKEGRGILSKVINTVSILLLLEIGLKAEWFPEQSRAPILFQSFFYWKSASKPSSFHPPSVCATVSILLLLEIGLKGSPAMLPRVSSVGFNPSSIGNRPQRRLSKMDDISYRRFQSFFYWKSASKPSSDANI